MKACPECGKKGMIKHASYKVIGPGAVQTIDHELTCPEHGDYDGHFKDQVVEGAYSDEPEIELSEENAASA